MVLVTHSNREGALKFVYVFSRTQPQHCNFVRRSGGGALLLEKISCFEYQPIRSTYTYADLKFDLSTITKAF